MNKFNPYKPIIISSIINLLIATILVSIFRNNYSQDSLAYDVFIFVLIVYLIQILFSIKNIFVSFKMY